MMWGCADFLGWQVICRRFMLEPGKSLEQTRAAIIDSGVLDQEAVTIVIEYFGVFTLEVGTQLDIKDSGEVVCCW
jgi:hypothetical protein